MDPPSFGNPNEPRNVSKNANSFRNVNILFGRVQQKIVTFITISKSMYLISRSFQVQIKSTMN